MEGSFMMSPEVELLLSKLRNQTIHLLQTRTEVEVVRQLQEAINLLRGTQVNTERRDVYGQEDTCHYVNMSEERGVKKRRLACAAEQCTELPTYGWPIWKPETCASHATIGMEEYVPKRRCGKGLPCTKHSSFGWPGHMQTCCKIHAAPGMENVVSKRCTTEGCVKRPVFGWEKQKATKCKAHAEPGMRDVTHAVCEGEDCSRRPSFGHPGSSRPTRCKVHAEPGMEDIVTKKCEVDGCFKAPDFGFGRESGRRCELHKEEGMVRKRNGGRVSVRKEAGARGQRVEGGEQGTPMSLLFEGAELASTSNRTDVNAEMYPDAYG